MILKTETLKEKGMTQEQIDYIMAEVGREVSTITAERDGYKTQLDTAQASLKAMEGIDAAALNQKITDLTTQLSGKDTEIANIRADYAFNDAVKEAIRKSGARNEKTVMALLDLDTLKASKNQQADITAAVEAVKKDNDYLFQSAKPVPKVVSSTPGIDNDAQTKKEAANEALRSFFGKAE